ncbi:hypothetical protein JHK82_048385 [Glycine max]|nr:hypothetical protein JHK82_048385 [Glycine max]
MRALLPITCFYNDETTRSQCDCLICIEEFKNGEGGGGGGSVLEFHSCCVNSWLLSGKTICPVFRKELSITMY